MRVSGVTIDITERKQAEQRQNLLAREVDHRAKNALALAQSIVRLTRGENVKETTATTHPRLWIPGPVEVDPDVLAVLATPLIGHRGPEFKQLYDACQPGLKAIFGTQRPVFVVQVRLYRPVECVTDLQLSRGYDTIFLGCPRSSCGQSKEVVERVLFRKPKKGDSHGRKEDPDARRRLRRGLRGNGAVPGASDDWPYRARRLPRKKIWRVRAYFNPRF